MAKPLSISWNKFNNDCEILGQHIKAKWPRARTVAGVPRGGLIAAVLVSHSAGLEYCHSIDKADVVVDDILDSGATLRGLFDKYPQKCLAAVYIRFDEAREWQGQGVVTAKTIFNDRWLAFPYERSEVPRRDGTLSRVV